ncbi:sugar transferase [Gemmatimonas sp.]|uniref:sugar transferase n=1 Tax=Gemmatimonas sp. TaxID=1962908 RepID=UPI00391F3EE6
MSPAKRAVDVVASLTGSLLLLPLFAVIAVAVRSDGGPVFFRQRRVGRHGREFHMWKFRSMVVRAEQTGPQLTAHGDPRITRVGRWLRRTKMDELPQLFNVLAGDMSLVGPRPEVPRYVALYTPTQRAVLALTPGITDPASLHYADESALLAEASDPEALYIGTLMPDKIARNLAYAQQATLASDVAVIVRTLLAATGVGRR